METRRRPRGRTSSRCGAAGELLPPFPAGPQIVFANGDMLPGHVVKIERGLATFRASLGRGGREAISELSIPLSALSVIWFRSPPQDSANEAARHWLSERRRRDVVMLNNGDARIGAMLGMKSPTDPVILKEESRETRIDAGHILAIAMNTDLARALRPRRAYGRLVLDNGGRLGLLSATADAAMLTGKTLFRRGEDPTRADRVAGYPPGQGGVPFRLEAAALRAHAVFGRALAV